MYRLGATSESLNLHDSQEAVAEKLYSHKKKDTVFVTEPRAPATYGCGVPHIVPTLRLGSIEMPFLLP